MQSLDIELIKTETQKNLKRNKTLLAVLFGLAILGLFIFIQFAPPMSLSEKEILIRIPWSAQEIYELGQVLSAYTVNYYWYVLCLFCFVYLLLQSFAIPGPIVLSLISGTLFGR